MYYTNALLLLVGLLGVDVRWVEDRRLVVHNVVPGTVAASSGVLTPGDEVPTLRFKDRARAMNNGITD
jgi:hypothetical protein